MKPIFLVRFGFFDVFCGLHTSCWNVINSCFVFNGNMFSEHIFNKNIVYNRPHPSPSLDPMFHICLVHLIFNIQNCWIFKKLHILWISVTYAPRLVISNFTPWYLCMHGSIDHYQRHPSLFILTEVKISSIFWWYHVAHITVHSSLTSFACSQF